MLYTSVVYFGFERLHGVFLLLSCTAFDSGIDCQYRDEDDGIQLKL